VQYTTSYTPRLGSGRHAAVGVDASRLFAERALEDPPELERVIERCSSAQALYDELSSVEA
jgi:hypothetical protein